MAIDYNATDPIPSSKVTMLGTRGAVKTVPWLSAACSFDHTQQDHDLYIRAGVLQSATQDVKTYDPASFYVATTSTGTLGDLWVEYDITLKDPSEYGGIGASFGATSPSAALAWGIYGSQASPKGQLPGSWSGNTFTFTIGGSFIVVGSFLGTLTAISPTTGTATLGQTAIAGNGAAAVLYIGVTALPGQTLVLSGAAGTITAADWYFASTIPTAITN